ncbi:hypothetical protein [Candidiatus Paracoxiella cheracis]
MARLIFRSKFPANGAPDHHKEVQACRDARDRLLPSLSIIDSQYATT